MENLKFIKVQTLESSYHIIRIDLIEYITPKKSQVNKSAIKLINCDIHFLSTETPSEIYDKINLELSIK